MAMPLEDVLLETSYIVNGENEVFHMEWDNLNKVTTKFMEIMLLTIQEV